MRCLPFALSRGALLTQVIREAQQDPRRQILCGCCGARIFVRQARPGETVRCPACLRLHRMSADAEVAWRLTADSAAALRRTKSWARR